MSGYGRWKTEDGEFWIQARPGSALTPGLVWGTILVRFLSRAVEGLAL